MKTLLLTFLCMLAVCLPCTASQTERTDSIDRLIQQAAGASMHKDYRLSYSLLFRAKQLADEQHDPGKLFWVHTNLGINQAEQYNYAEALTHFSQAYHIATAHFDKRKVLSIRNNMAGVYMLDNQNDRALKEYLDIYALIDPAERQSAFCGGCALNIANLYIDAADTTRALPYLRVADRLLAHSAADSVSLLSAHVNYLLAARQPAQAHALVMKALLPHTAQADTATVPAELRLLRARTSLACGLHGETVAIVQQLLRETDDPGTRCTLFDLMAEALQAEGNYRDALLFKDSVIHASQRLQQARKQVQIESLQMQFDLQRQQQEMQSLHTRHRLTLLLMVLSVACLVATACALLFQIRARRRQRQVAELERQQQLEREQRLQAELAQQQQQAEMEQTRAQLAMEQRNQELMSKALMAANKYDQLRALLHQLLEEEKKGSERNPALRKNIVQLQRQLDSTDEWRDFTTYFEQVNISFLMRLIEAHPTLTANELRYLSLVSINLTSKEIARLLNITPEYCKKKKQLISRKMGLDNPHNLYAYLIQMQVAPDAAAADG
ncbi:MAG: hypothetical protein ACI3YD_07695 [Alloprevotella sp.]